MIRKVSARASIEEEPASFAIKIRAGRTHPLLGAGVIGALAVIAVVLTVVAMARGAITPLVFLPWFALLLGWEALWRGLGHEDVLLAAGRGRIERRIGSWLLWSTEFPAQSIRNVEARHWPIGLPDPMWRYDAWGLSRGAIAIELDGRVVRIGTALREEETGPLVAALRAQLTGLLRS